MGRGILKCVCLHTRRKDDFETSERFAHILNGRPSDLIIIQCLSCSKLNLVSPEIFKKGLFNSELFLSRLATLTGGLYNYCI